MEGKVIVDKQFGNILAAGNVVLEHEWKTGLDSGFVQNSSEVKFSLNAGISFSITKAFSIGIEAAHQSIFEKGELEHAAFFAGPVVSYSTDQWWATWTFLPQLAGTAGTSGSTLNLKEFEKIQARLMFSLFL